MFKDNKQKYNFITFILSVIFSLIGSEILLRLLDLGYNNGPLNPSKTSHHEHPYNFKFTSYSPQGEWDNILVEYDEFGNRVIDRNCELNSSEKNYDIFSLVILLQKMLKSIVQKVFQVLFRMHYVMRVQ